MTAAEKQSGKLWGNTFVLLLADGTKKSVSNLEHDLSPSSESSSSAARSLASVGSRTSDASREPMVAMVRDLVTLAVEFHHQLPVTDTSA